MECISSLSEKLIGVSITCNRQLKFYEFLKNLVNFSLDRFLIIDFQFLGRFSIFKHFQLYNFALNANQILSWHHVRKMPINYKNSRLENKIYSG